MPYKALVNAADIPVPFKIRLPQSAPRLTHTSAWHAAFGQPLASASLVHLWCCQAATPGFGQPSSFGAGFRQRLPANPAAFSAAAFGSSLVGRAGGFAALAQESSLGFGATSAWRYAVYMLLTLDICTTCHGPTYMRC